MSGLHGEECVCDDCMAYDDLHDSMRVYRSRAAVLENRVRELEGVLESVASSVCSRLCPTQWKTADGYRHHESCERVRAALSGKAGT